MEKILKSNLSKNLKKNERLKQRNKVIGGLLSENRQVVNTPEKLLSKFRRRELRNIAIEENLLDHQNHNPKAKLKQSVTPGTPFVSEYLKKQLPPQIKIALRQAVTLNIQTQKILKKERKEIEFSRSEIKRLNESDKNVLNNAHKISTTRDLNEPSQDEIKQELQEVGITAFGNPLFEKLPDGSTKISF